MVTIKDKVLEPFEILAEDNNFTVIEKVNYISKDGTEKEKNNIHGYFGQLNKALSHTATLLLNRNFEGRETSINDYIKQLREVSETIRNSIDANVRL